MVGHQVPLFILTQSFVLIPPKVWFSINVFPSPLKMVHRLGSQNLAHREVLSSGGL